MSDVSDQYEKTDTMPEIVVHQERTVRGDLPPHLVAIGGILWPGIMSIGVEVGHQIPGQQGVALPQVVELRVLWPISWRLEKDPRPKGPIALVKGAGNADRILGGRG